MKSLLPIALDYASSYGWAVHPVNIHKKPTTENGFYDATTDETTIREYFKNGAQLSIRTGDASGVLIFDVDLDPAKGIDGYATLAKLEAEHGPLPRTPHQRTGRGGTHYFFKHIAGVRNSTSKIGPGIDIRAEGGYAVVAPSRNESGAYAWIVSPDEAPLADVPAWLAALLTAEPVRPAARSAPPAARNLDPYIDRAFRDEIANVATAPDGTKHDVLRNAAIKLGTLIAHGLDEQAIEDALYNAISGRADDPDNALRTIRDGIEYGAVRPRTIPERQQSSPSVHRQFTSPSEPRQQRLLGRAQLGTIPLTTWLIDGVLASNKLSQTFAPPGSGKSFLELDKALCVSQRYPVIYVAAEAVEDYEERVAAWEAHHGQQAGQIYFWPDPIALKDPASVNAFLTEIHPIGPAAIFIDPLASCMVGLEESSTGDMTIAVEALNTIRRETGAAVHIVHHTGWNDAHERGSSVLRAACRIVMKLSLDDSGLMTLTCEKANNGKPFESRYFRLVAAGSSAVPVPANKIAMRDAPLSEKQFAVMETLDLLHLRDGATFSQIQEHTNLAKSTVNKAISRLMELGSISCEKSRSTTYRLTSKGNSELAARLEASISGARTPVHHGGELTVNWTVNNLPADAGISHQDAEFTQFTTDRENMAPVHPAEADVSSMQFTESTASECASSPQFTPSSPSVHPYRVH
jgi:DNA-binding MarR family transcriptional regulator